TALPGRPVTRARSTRSRRTWASSPRAASAAWGRSGELQLPGELLVVVAGVAEVVLPVLVAAGVELEVVVDDEGLAGVDLVGLAVEVGGRRLAEGDGDGGLPGVGLAGVDAVGGLPGQQVGAVQVDEHVG